MKKSKVISHLRVSRIKTYMEKACYLGSPWLVGSQETQKWTKIKSALLTKMRHGKPLCFGVLEMSFGVWEMSFAIFWEISFAQNAQKSLVCIFEISSQSDLG